MSTLTWDAATGTAAVLHAVAGWDTGRALCGAYVVPVRTARRVDMWLPRCRRCTTAAQR